MDAATAQPNGDYKVDIAVFQGPLDLLLYLIRKEEVDIYDIPIARITRQYLKYIEMMTTLNLEVAGEFILMAATLIRIKVRLLLPRDVDDPDEFDPREELIMALIEYKKYKEASEILRDKAIDEQRKFIPPSPVGKMQSKIDLSPGTSIFDLLIAFKDVLSTTHEEIIHEVEPEEILIEDRIKTVMAFMAQRDFATFTELFTDIPRKIVAVVTFIALLELCRTRRIKLMQASPFSELRVTRGDLFDAPLQAVDLVDLESGKVVQK